MIELTAPENVGLDGKRLTRLADHFDRYVDDGKLPGYLALVARRGQAAYLHGYGYRDVAAGQPIAADTIFRIYSMTKPVASVGIMQLYERGLLQLDDPVSEYVAGFDRLEVYESGAGEQVLTVPAEREMTIRDLLTHTSGLTYDHLHAHPVDAMYRQRLQARGSNSGLTLARLVQSLSQLPLLFSPGTRWNYSYATDVLGYVIEVVAGKALDEFFADEILQPLGMADTGFMVAPGNVDRFAACYERDGAGFRLNDAPGDSRYLQRPAFLSGGGGLVSTAGDYLRFCQMLLNGGQLDGVRILGRKTVELMLLNHLPNNADLASMGYRFSSESRARAVGMGFGSRYNMRRGGLRSETRHDGVGFGLGGAVLLDPAAAQILGSAGEFFWGGAASTVFWIDPQERMTVIFLTQLMPSSSYPIRRQLRILANQAIIN